MKFEYTPPPYSDEDGVTADYCGEYQISISANGLERGDIYVNIAANRDGLVTLAMHLLALAQQAVPPGCHFHWDPPPIGNLEPGSVHLVLEKT